MIRARDVTSLTDFRQNASAHLDRLAETRSAQVLTVNGKARGVVLSPEVFDELVEKAELVESLERLDAGYADAVAGRGSDLRDSLRVVSRELGLAEPA